MNYELEVVCTLTVLSTSIIQYTMSPTTLDVISNSNTSFFTLKVSLVFSPLRVTRKTVRASAMSSD